MLACYTQTDTQDSLIFPFYAYSQYIICRRILTSIQTVLFLCFHSLSHTHSLYNQEPNPLLSSLLCSTTKHTYTYLNRIMNYLRGIFFFFVSCVCVCVRVYNVVLYIIWYCFAYTYMNPYLSLLYVSLLNNFNNKPNQQHCA